VEDWLDEAVVAEVVGVLGVLGVLGTVWTTEEVVVGGEVFLEVVGLVLTSVVVPGCVLFDDDEPSGQKVINKLALSSWHAIWTQVSSGCRKAVLQAGESHVVATPSQPPKNSIRVGTEKVWGSISEISALDPPPTATGLVIVSSSNVHFSPLNKQSPVWR